MMYGKHAHYSSGERFHNTIVILLIKNAKLFFISVNFHGKSQLDVWRAATSNLLQYAMYFLYYF